MSHEPCSFTPDEVERIADDVVRNASMSTWRGEPAQVRGLRRSGVAGEGTIVRDMSGKVYSTARLWRLLAGYRHPRVVAAVQEQLNRLPEDALPQPACGGSRALAEVSPAPAIHVLCNSGTEAGAAR